MPNLPMPYPMPYLSNQNNAFRTAVSRTFGYKSRSLDTVLAAVTAYQNTPDVDQFRILERAVDAWRRENPLEYANRLGAIRDNFEGEIRRERARLIPAVGNMAWVRQVGAELDAMKEYVVDDILQYVTNVNPKAHDECWARHADSLQARPAPLRQGNPLLPPPGHNHPWNARRALGFYNFTRYVASRDIRFTPQAPTAGNPNGIPYVGPNGVRQTRATGCAICTQFAYAAVHVLTHGRPAIPGVPRVEIVAWQSPTITTAHVFVIVGRQVAPGVAPGQYLPQPPTTWGPDVVIVDTWQGALGHKVAYQLSDGDFPHEMLRRLELVMARPAG